MRQDGTRVKNLTPIMQALPYIMPRRFCNRNPPQFRFFLFLLKFPKIFLLFAVVLAKSQTNFS